MRLRTSPSDPAMQGTGTTITMALCRLVEEGADVTVGMWG